MGMGEGVLVPRFKGHMVIVVPWYQGTPTPPLVEGAGDGGSWGYGVKIGWG